MARWPDEQLVTTAEGVLDDRTIELDEDAMFEVVPMIPDWSLLQFNNIVLLQLVFNSSRAKQIFQRNEITRKTRVLTCLLTTKK